MKPDFSFFPRLAVNHAQSPALRSLFEELIVRGEELGRLHQELQITIVRNREARTGKPFHFTKRQEQTLRRFEEDRKQAEMQLQSNIVNLDDVGLLRVAVRTEHDAIVVEQNMYSTHSEDNRAAATRILKFRRETLGIIQNFIENSEFKNNEVREYLASLKDWTKRKK